MEEQTAYEPNWILHKKQRERTERINKIKQTLYGYFIGFLFFIHLGRAYQRTLCFLGLYKKFSEHGRCMWCGEVHGFWHFINPIDRSQIEKEINERIEKMKGEI